MTARNLCALAIVAAFAVSVGSCGGDGGSTPTAPSPGGGTGTVAATITVDASGVLSPRDVTVAPGSRVTFVNNHNRAHQPASEPHPEHGSCPAIDQIGTIAVGQSRTSGNLNTPGACRYHDHLDDRNTSLQGVIRVQ
jgi:plastocyanin